MNKNRFKTTTTVLYKKCEQKTNKYHLLIFLSKISTKLAPCVTKNPQLFCRKIQQNWWPAWLKFNKFFLLKFSTKLATCVTKNRRISYRDPTKITTKLSDITTYFSPRCTRGNTELNRWRNSVRDMLIADFVEDYSRRAIDG